MLRLPSFLLVSAVGTVFLPALTSAHTRWFAQEALLPYRPTEPTVLYLTASAFIAVGAICIAAYFQRRKWFQLDWLRPKGAHAFDRAAATFSMVAGAFFVVAGTHEYLFSPNMEQAVGVSALLIVVQVFVGLAFLVGVYARVAALVLALIWGLSILLFGWVPMLENIWVLSTALFVFVMGTDYFSLVSFKLLQRYADPFRAHALALLRVGTGATLLVLGFSEKILHPEFGMSFLQQYHWNFMQALGFSGYSDYLFTLSAGSVEALLGVLLIGGLMTRVVALIVAIFFTIPLFILGPIELAGHLPHFAAVIILVLFGADASSGSARVRPIRQKKRRFVHR